MKKSILVLAVLGAFAGAASAQSSVTLYGRLDTAVVWTDQGEDFGGAGNGDDVWSMNGHDPIGGSRWGLRGVEDLGGGLKALFVLESGFNSDTGAATPALFNRQAFVGLSSNSLGEIRLGRQQTLHRELNLLAADIAAEGELSIVSEPAGRVLFQNLGNAGDTRIDNAVQYLSPNFGGFQIRGLVAAGEGVIARQQGVMVSYSAGPLKAGLVYEAFDGGPSGVDGSYNKVGTAAVSYNFGFATLLGSYQTTRDLGTATALIGGGDVDHDAYNVGVMVPIGALEFRAQYTTSTVELPGGDVDTDRYGASLRYSLSKRTQLYTSFTRFSGDNDETFNRKTQVAFGVGHNF